jgi:hypothetical protein
MLLSFVKCIPRSVILSLSWMSPVWSLHCRETEYVCHSCLIVPDSTIIGNISLLGNTLLSGIVYQDHWCFCLSYICNIGWVAESINRWLVVQKDKVSHIKNDMQYHGQSGHCCLQFIGAGDADASVSCTEVVSKIAGNEGGDIWVIVIWTCQFIPSFITYCSLEILSFLEQLFWKYPGFPQIKHFFSIWLKETSWGTSLVCLDSTLRSSSKFGCCVDDLLLSFFFFASCHLASHLFSLQQQRWILLFSWCKPCLQVLDKRFLLVCVAI